MIPFVNQSVCLSVSVGPTGHPDQPPHGGGREPVLPALPHPRPEPQVYHHGGTVRRDQQTDPGVVRRTHGHHRQDLCTGRLMAGGSKFLWGGGHYCFVLGGIVIAFVLLQKKLFLSIKSLWLV